MRSDATGPGRGRRTERSWLQINEIQESEIELLSNMYMDDFSICDDDIDYDWPRGFAIRIRVSNEVQGDDRIYPSMTLSVRSVAVVAPYGSPFFDRILKAFQENTPMRFLDSR